MTTALPVSATWHPISRNKFTSRWATFTILGVLVCLFSGLVLFPQTHVIDFQSDSFSVDEPGWIAASYYYTKLLRGGDLDWEKWNCPTCGLGSSYGSLNMHLGEWLIGIPLMMDARTANRPFSGYYDVSTSLDRNIHLGNVPPADTLVRARTAPALFGSLCCLLVFAIGFWAYNASIGLIASGLVLANPVFSKLAGQVMTDTFYNFFLLSCCLGLILLFRTKNVQRSLVVVSLTGVLTGLACSVKVTGIIVGSIFFLLAIAWHFYNQRYSKRWLVAVVALFGLSALITVYALNPLFWPSWQDAHSKAAIRELHSVSSTALATKRLPWKDRTAFLADDNYPELKNLSRPFEFPMLFSRWNHMMENQRSTGGANWHGPRFLNLQETLFQLAVPGVVSWSRSHTLSVVGPAALFMFAVIGVVSIINIGRGTTASSRDDSHLVPLMQLLANYLLIVFFMKLNWDRYYLPTMMPLEIVSAVGIYSIWQHGFSAFATYRRFRAGSNTTATSPKYLVAHVSSRKKPANLRDLAG